jgi:hypothetical protein
MIETALTVTVIATIIWLWDFNKRIGFRDLFHDPKIGRTAFSKNDEDDDDDR